MIIFDLDCLSDDSHRRHFVDRFANHSEQGYVQKKTCSCEYPHEIDPWIYGLTGEPWQPDYRAFYDACDKDLVIHSVADCLHIFCYSLDNDVQIWSGRCESVRSKTVKWFYDNFEWVSFWDPSYFNTFLKMRPIGDDRPQEELFEEWLNKEMKLGPFGNPTSIDMVFSSHAPTIAIFRKRGVFVFDCNQDNHV